MCTGRSIFVFFAMLLVAAFLLAACGDSTEEFCNLARTSAQERTEEQINEYYTQLEAAAPDELKGKIVTLREGWKQVSFPLDEMISGELKTVSRPPEVSQAAREVSTYVKNTCDFEGGVYLVLPEAGY